MNKIVFAVSVAMVALMGVVNAGADPVEVTSPNVVGYVKVDLPQGLSLVSTPFNQTDGSSQKLADVFGMTTPDNTEVIFYTQGTGYRTFTFVEGDGWVDSKYKPANPEIPRGVGFWVRSPSAFSVYIMGDVPMAVSEDIGLVQGLQLVSHAYPTDRSLTEAGIVPEDNDELIRYVPGVGYTTYTYVEGDGWVDSKYKPVSVVLYAGESYWYRSGSNKTWTQTKPYTL